MAIMLLSCPALSAKILVTLCVGNIHHDVPGPVNHSINRTEITNKMQPCTRIYYSSVY